MMRMRTKTVGMGLGVPPTDNNTAAGGGNGEGNWEMRPGGMLVQMRTESDQNRPPPPTIRVRVKYGALYHEINISSQATFGELKKMLTGPTGLHHQDQKLLFKDKERDNNAFLDTVGVKDKSKIVLMEDPISQEKRFLEMRKSAKMEKAAKSISEISLEVDRLAGQVSAYESVISRGGRVAEKDLLNLIEVLMNQLLRLDGIVADGDVKLQRKMQVKRVQKLVETLDVLKIKNSTPSSNGDTSSMANHINIEKSSPVQLQQQRRNSYDHVPSPVEQHRAQHSGGMLMQQQEQLQPSRHSASGPVLITTQWETFDSMPMQATHSASAASTSTFGTTQPRFNWDLL
ncbi:OLC1v1006054C1 [Oldenlandia corymbosa var. corymbosa]|uniref:OLC1v1006054C1 n=1 Tax=Oldenlandia corymbosa var. corymbosa TaxID=529605 RepID=A0AAV1DG75_OLDCO|nr:OLC1v1006054C1 [Oldenlandia corymbosa var. corymbosa]